MQGVVKIPVLREGLGLVLLHEALEPAEAREFRSIEGALATSLWRLMLIDIWPTDSPASLANSSFLAPWDPCPSRDLLHYNVSGDSHARMR